MSEYILYTTHKGKNARWVIKRSTDSPPCTCIWVEHSRYETLYQALEAKNKADKDE